MVLMTAEFKLADSLKKTYRKACQDGRWVFRFDSAFENVMRACAEPRKNQAGTWISEEIIEAYCQLHQGGYAHSSEAWFDGKLVGGAYGVCIGKMFYGESMFAKVTDASKMAFLHLVQHLRQQGVEMIDCQQETAHLARFGARPITRAEFIERMRKAQHAGHVVFDSTMAVAVSDRVA
jgi:leucyl/phenylalanyl-tRNA--protein transferase